MCKKIKLNNFIRTRYKKTERLKEQVRDLKNQIWADICSTDAPEDRTTPWKMTIIIINFPVLKTDIHLQIEEAQLLL